MYDMTFRASERRSRRHENLSKRSFGYLTGIRHKSRAEVDWCSLSSRPDLLLGGPTRAVAFFCTLILRFGSLRVGLIRLLPFGKKPEYHTAAPERRGHTHNINEEWRLTN